MKIYTKTGDQGTTALFGGTRVPKDHARIESAFCPLPTITANKQDKY